MFHVPEVYRLRAGPLQSSPADGNNGAFLLLGPCRQELKLIASDNDGWEHVSISLKNRCPNWQEMCFVKDLFWDAEDTVIQYHPPKSDYVNCHPYCLHLFRPIGIELPRPPKELIGGI